MANTRKKTAVERIKLSLWAKAREANKRALRQVAAKQESLLVKTGQDKQKSTTVMGHIRAFAEMVRAGFAAKTPVQACPQNVPVQTDEHAVSPVVAHPRFATADSVLRQSIHSPNESGAALRGMIEEYNSGSHTGWRTKGRQ